MTDARTRRWTICPACGRGHWLPDARLTTREDQNFCTPDCLEWWQEWQKVVHAGSLDLPAALVTFRRYQEGRYARAVAANAERRERARTELAALAGCRSSGPAPE